MLPLLYLIGVALLFAHELDAIRAREWRLFPFLRVLGEANAYRAFVLLHIPLFLLFLWMSAYPRLWFEIGVDLFLVVHAGLHWLFRNSPYYEFKGWLSHGLIVGAGAIGALHLVLLLF